MPQLILLPGLACDHRLWEAQLPVLPPALQPVVTTVHARHDTIESMASALLAEHVGQLVLCGASMGGMIAMEAVRQAPGRIAGLALLGTTPRAETADMRDLRSAAIELFERGDVRDVIEPNVAFAFHPAQATEQAMVERYLDMVLEAGAAQLICQNRAVMQRPDATRHLATVRCPVMVMYGDGDCLTPPECSLEIASLLPRADLIRVPACGHMLTMEKPAFVNAALLRWLQKIIG